MKKKFPLVMLLLALCMTMTVSAESMITKTFEYETDNPNAVFTVADELEENGVSYRLASVDQKVVSSMIPKKNDIQKVDMGTYLTKESATKNEMVIDGATYTLQGITYTAGTVTDRVGSYTHKVEYFDVVRQPDAAQTLPISFVDQATNETVTTTVALKGIKQVSDWRWVDDLKIPMKVTPQEAMYFSVGDILLENKEQLDISGNEAALLKELGLNEQSYSLDRAEWSGEFQTAEDGSSYREAVIYGSRYVASFVAEYYADQIPLPDADGYSAQAIYQGQVDDMQNASYTVQVTATYEPIKSLVVPIAAAATTTAVACGIFLLIFFTKRNLIVHQNGKPLYKTRIRKGSAYIPKKVIARRDPYADLMVTIKKGYAKHHNGESVEIVSECLPTLDAAILSKENQSFLLKKAEN